MKIGVDATVWFNQRGYGRHARGLLNHLVSLDRKNDYLFVFDGPVPPADLPKGIEIRNVPVSRLTINAASAESRRSVRDLLRISMVMSSKEFDVVLFPTVYSYVPVWSRAVKIVMIHDIIPEIYPELTLPRRSARFFWQTKSALARWQVDAVITVSEYSKKLICDYFHIPSRQVFVVSEAADPVFHKINPPEIIRLSSELLSLDLSKFLLFIGGFGPHKNLDTLVTVFARIAGLPEYSDLKLVFVGEYRKEAFYSTYEKIQQQIDALGLSKRVIFTGYLPDEQVNGLLNQAQALVLPSLMEGFGLPAVEAAACGCPVIATQLSPLPGLLGDAGIFIDPKSLEELEIALLKVLSSPDQRAKMGEAGLAAAGRLTWEKAALDMKNILDQFGKS